MMVFKQLQTAQKWVGGCRLRSSRSNTWSTATESSVEDMSSELRCSQTSWFRNHHSQEISRWPSSIFTLKSTLTAFTIYYAIIKGSVERSLLPSAIFLIFTQNRPWKSEDHLCKLFFIEMSKERLEKSGRAPPFSLCPWALAYSRDWPYNFSCLSAMSKNGHLRKFFSRQQHRIVSPCVCDGDVLDDLIRRLGTCRWRRPLVHCACGLHALPGEPLFRWCQMKRSIKTTLTEDFMDHHR